MGALVLLAVLCGSAAAAIADEPCDLRLTVELTPDVPDASDDGFLSSLLNNHPEYRLELLREDDASVVELALSGPGPEYRCQSVIETMRKDARVLSIRVDSIGAVATGLATGSFSGSEPLDEHMSERGLEALYWAAHHPRQAWRIVLPILSSDAAADEKPQG
jgi:hypothetical protein